MFVRNLEFNSFPHEDYLANQREIDEAIQQVLKSGNYILGASVADFEREFASLMDSRYAVGVANGTDAIEIILRALGLGYGAKVAVPSYTAVATASGISRAGAEPVFVDIDPETFTLCPTSLKNLLDSNEGKHVRAVVAVHLYGHPAAWQEIKRVADAFGVHLIEDCAQAAGALYHGHHVGSLGRAAAFSFYPTKNLAAIGDGGAITTNDGELSERIRRIRQYGWHQRHTSEEMGVNSRLDELQAAILRIKMRSIHAMQARRRSIAKFYDENLANVPDVRTPVVRPDCVHAYHLYVIRSNRRDALMEYLAAQGIPVARHYPFSVHQQPAYAHVAAHSPALSHTEAAISSILTLPLHPYLTTGAMNAVCEAVYSFHH